jgi:hypothetical protein
MVDEIVDEALFEEAREVTVIAPNGVRTRLDLVLRNRATGEVTCVECKASETAPLTRNQTSAHPEIERGGATVVGEGKKGFEGGTAIPSGKVRVIRPSNLEDVPRR